MYNTIPLSLNISLQHSTLATVSALVSIHQTHSSRYLQGYVKRLRAGTGLRRLILVQCKDYLNDKNAPVLIKNNNNKNRNDTQNNTCTTA